MEAGIKIPTNYVMIVQMLSKQHKLRTSQDLTTMLT